jgi:hypothetical protein
MASAAVAPQAAAFTARAALRGAKVTRKTANNTRRGNVSVAVRAAISDPPSPSIKDVQRPDKTGRYGRGVIESKHSTR